MKCLTILQPYASLITNGPRDVENRTWGTSYRGWLLIHAGADRQYSARLTDYQAWEEVMGWASKRRRDQKPSERWADCIRPDPMPFGAVIGSAWLEGVYPLAEDAPAEARAVVPEVYGPWAEGPACWVLRHAFPLARPFFCGGAARLWSLLPNDAEKVRALFLETPGRGQEVAACIRPLT